MPEEYKERVLREAHCTPSTEHLGIEKTYDRVVREYCWKGVYYGMQNFLKECDQSKKYQVSQIGA